MYSVQANEQLHGSLFEEWASDPSLSLKAKTFQFHPKLQNLQL